MTLPATGPISVNMVGTELGYTPTNPLDFNNSTVRALAGRPSGSISLADLRGKSSYVPMTMIFGSTENGNSDPLYWYSPANPASSYTYTCGFQVIITGGLAPYTFVYSKSTSPGNLTYQGNGANWYVPVPKFTEGGVIVAQADFTCTVTDSTNRQITISKRGILVTI